MPRSQDQAIETDLTLPTCTDDGGPAAGEEGKRRQTPSLSLHRSDLSVFPMEEVDEVRCLCFFTLLTRYTQVRNKLGTPASEKTSSPEIPIAGKSTYLLGTGRHAGRLAGSLPYLGRYYFSRT